MKEQEQNIPKEPYNLSLSTTIIEETEDMIHNLKRNLPRDKRRKLNRSKFFELVLEALIFNYKAEQKNSEVQLLVSSWSNSE